MQRMLKISLVKAPESSALWRSDSQKRAQEATFKLYDQHRQKMSFA